MVRAGKDDEQIFTWSNVVKKFSGGIISGAGTLVFQEVVDYLGGQGQSLESFITRSMQAVTARILDAIDEAFLRRLMARSWESRGSSPISGVIPPRQPTRRT